jgi:hypothetical protein
MEGSCKEMVIVPMQMVVVTAVQHRVVLCWGHLVEEAVAPGDAGQKGPKEPSREREQQ